MIEAAKLVARLAHGHQQYGGYPYTYHLQMVVNILNRYGISESSFIAAGWLHDVLEDTDVNYEELRNAFGPVTAQIVEACTGRGANRKARNADIYSKINRVGLAKPIKLADRMANLQQCILHNPGLLDMYLAESIDFQEALGPLEGRTATMLAEYLHMSTQREPLQWLVDLTIKQFAQGV